MLHIFNTLTRQKEQFVSITPNYVGIYVCGITVYNLCHLGHARTFIAFDVIIRYLIFCGYKVKYVRNITDIDDKIIDRALKNNEDYKELTNRMINEMNYDFHVLNVIKPNYEPRVTQYINVIILLISNLIKNDYAYINYNGDVAFNINNYNNYGILLSNKTSLNNFKKNLQRNIIYQHYNSADFILWKMSKLGEPKWKSPWGYGRPGWHIECLAMNYILLGKHFDIHGGGVDLIFPHHENEIAQSFCLNHSSYVNVWMHSGLVMMNHDKMSKSLHNFITIRDILKRCDPETLRYFLISVHYRTNINYNEDNLKQARVSLERLYIALRGTDITALPSGGESFIARFINEMDNDFNTPGAYSILFDIAHNINYLKSINSPAVHGMAATLRFLGNILGLLYQIPEIFLQNSFMNTAFHIEKIEMLIKQRDVARKQRQWVIADKLRDLLTDMDIILEDTIHGTTWRKSNLYKK